MKQIQFSERVQPELVFDYYDAPLMFISEPIDDTRHFFYYIEDGTYFWMPLTDAYERFLRYSYKKQHPSHERILGFLLSHKVLQIIKFKSEYVADVYDIKDYEDQFGDVTSDFEYQFCGDTALKLDIDIKWEIPISFSLFTHKD